MKKKFDLGTVQLEMENNSFPKGFILKRDLTVKESRYLMDKFIGININTIDDCYDREEYNEYNKELASSVNGWLKGDIDDQSLIEYAGCCADDPVGVFNIIQIIVWLKKKEII